MELKIEDFLSTLLQNTKAQDGAMSANVIALVRAGIIPSEEYLMAIRILDEYCQKANKPEVKNHPGTLVMLDIKKAVGQTDREDEIMSSFLLKCTEYLRDKIKAKAASESQTVASKVAWTESDSYFALTFFSWVADKIIRSSFEAIFTSVIPDLDQNCIDMIMSSEGNPIIKEDIAEYQIREIGFYESWRQIHKTDKMKPDGSTLSEDDIRTLFEIHPTDAIKSQIDAYYHLVQILIGLVGMDKARQIWNETVPPSYRTDSDLTE